MVFITGVLFEIQGGFKMGEETEPKPESSGGAPDYWPDSDGTIPACRGLWIKMVDQILSMTNPELANECRQKTKTPFDQLEEMDFYDIENHFGLYCRNALHSFQGAKVVETVGRRIFPTLLRISPGAIEEEIKQLGMTPSPQSACCSTKISYPAHNVGIGSGVNVVKAEEGIFIAEFDKMSHLCELWRGIFLGAAELFGGQHAEVKESKCRRQIRESEPAFNPDCEYGSPVCRFEIAWTT